MTICLAIVLRISLGIIIIETSKHLLGTGESKTSKWLWRSFRFLVPLCNTMTGLKSTRIHRFYLILIKKINWGGSHLYHTLPMFHLMSSSSFIWCWHICSGDTIFQYLLSILVMIWYMLYFGNISPLRLWIWFGSRQYHLMWWSLIVTDRGKVVVCVSVSKFPNFTSIRI